MFFFLWSGPPHFFNPSGAPDDMGGKSNIQKCLVQIIYFGLKEGGVTKAIGSEQ